MRALAATRDINERSKPVRILMVLVYIVAVLAAATASAQRTRKKDEDAKPKIEEVKLKTKDGIELRAFYLPSEKEKDAITVMLVHEWQGQASPYGKLVSALRAAGCAVLVPDYRGHGESSEYINARGETDTFNTAQMSKRDIERIITYDLERAKAFLKEQNNEGKCNLNALVVIGVREGCVMAARWAQRDWNFPSVGRMKQGQDVKALILISPEKQIKGIGIDPALTDRNLLRLPMMVVAGDSSPEVGEARRLAKRIEGIKKRMGGGQATGFELHLAKTNLSGPGLVYNVNSVIPAITKFVTSQVPISDDANPWIERD